MVGRTISHYRIVGQLGTGGMGVVYRAEDLRLGRGVALKFVSEDFAHDPSAVQRLRSEARAASALNHPNICTIYEIDEEDGHPFIVMELMKGQTLRDRLSAGHLRVHQIVSMGIEIADALDAAHSTGIVHRDIKPGNIFVTERGAVKVLDFGLAKLSSRSPASATTTESDRTALGFTLGTVSYMSPEQAAGEELDGRTDLFSLGVVLYEVATGRHPFPGKTTAVVLAAILNRAPVAPTALNPELPLRLQEVINNCLEKDRELRYQSAADLRADLKRVKRDLESGQSRPVAVVGEGATAPAGSASSPVASAVTGSTVATARFRALLPVSAVAVILALFAVGGYVLWQRGALAMNPPSAGERTQRGVSPAAGDLDGAIAEGRRHLAAGDLVAAGRALETARGIDATSPAVAELSAQLARSAEERRDSTAVERGATSQAADSSMLTPGAPAETARVQTVAPRATQEPPPRVSPSVPVPPVVRSEASSQPQAKPTSTSTAMSTLPSTTTSAPPTNTAVTPPVAVSPSAPVPATSAPPTPASPSPPLPPASGAVPGGTGAAPATGRADRRQENADAGADQDEAAIRSVAATYARAIENKDITLFRSIKPNLSGSEERRLRDGFNAVSSQRVHLTVLAIDRRGDRASVAVRRRDTINVGGREETSERGQTLTLARSNDAWVIVDIR